ncbi:MAG: VWA domain-containing protein [Pseudomonadota bacterium]
MGGLEFTHLWAFLLLPLPLLATRLLPASARRRALPVPAGVSEWLDAVADPRGSGLLTLPSRAVLLMLGWAALVLALSGPFLRGDRLLEPTGRDLTLAIDLSASMAETDIATEAGEVPRYTIVREVASDFLERRTGDRIALIGFGSEAFLIAPLTFDARAVAGMLDEMTIGLPGRKTDLGQAIGLTIKTLEQEPAAERLLVILSDGETNTGVLGALDAARLAKERGVTIHTIGFASELEADNVDAMTSVAEATGGQFFAADSKEALAQIYAQIEALAPVASDRTDTHLVRDLSVFPMLLALVILAALGWREMQE